MFPRRDDPRVAAQKHRSYVRWHTKEARNIDDNVDHMEACGLPPDLSDKPLAAAQEHRDCVKWHRKTFLAYDKHAVLLQTCDGIHYDYCDNIREAYADFHGAILDKMWDGHCARK